MTETNTEYQVSDKNQAKIQKVASALVAKLNDWVSSNANGQRKFTVELHTGQGGITDMFIEENERGRV